MILFNYLRGIRIILIKISGQASGAGVFLMLLQMLL